MTIARELLASGECSAACLLAYAPHGPDCGCRCGGRWHGMLADAEVETSGGTTRRPKKRDTLPGGSVMLINTWRKWGKPWANLLLNREFRPPGLHTGPDFFHETIDEVWYVAVCVQIHAMARCFDAGYEGGICTGSTQDIWEITMPRDDLAMVRDAVAALDLGQGYKAFTYLGTPCAWGGCVEDMDYMLRSDRRNVGEYVIDCVRREHSATARAASTRHPDTAQQAAGI